MSTLNKLTEFTEYLEDLIQNKRVNGNTSDDKLISIYEEAKSLESKIEDFRKDSIRPQLRERANQSGERTEKDYPVLRGEEKYIYFYSRKSSSVLVDELKSHFKEMINEAESEEKRNEYIDLLFDMTKSFKVTSVRDFDPSFLDESKPGFENHCKYGYNWSTGDVEDILVRKAEPYYEEE